MANVFFGGRTDSVVVLSWVTYACCILAGASGEDAIYVCIRLRQQLLHPGKFVVSGSGALFVFGLAVNRCGSVRWCVLESTCRNEPYVATEPGEILQIGSQWIPGAVHILPHGPKASELQLDRMTILFNYLGIRQS